MRQIAQRINSQNVVDIAKAARQRYWRRFRAHTETQELAQAFRDGELTADDLTPDQRAAVGEYLVTFPKRARYREGLERR